MILSDEIKNLNQFFSIFAFFGTDYIALCAISDYYELSGMNQHDCSKIL